MSFRAEIIKQIDDAWKNIPSSKFDDLMYSLKSKGHIQDYAKTPDWDIFVLIDNEVYENVNGALEKSKMTPEQVKKYIETY